MTLHLIEEIGYAAAPSQLSAIARRLLATLLAERCGIATLPVISVLPSGKPYFPDHPNIHFSLSHCPKAVMAVISDSQVGCDIEEVQKGQDIIDELLHVAFSDTERTAIANSTDHALELTRIWTRKEAYVKRTGSIPDDPTQWPSEMPGIFTYCEELKGYVYSICH